MHESFTLNWGMPLSVNRDMVEYFINEFYRTEMVNMEHFGDINGEVYFWLHPIYMPFMPNFSTQWFQDNHIRIIMPLRDGYLEQRDEMQDLTEYFNNSVDTIDAFAKLLGFKKINLMSSVNSISIALEYARRNSDKINKLILFNLLMTGNKGINILKTFRSGLTKLVMSNQSLVFKIQKYYTEKLKDPTEALRIIKRTAGNYEPDYEIYKKITNSQYLHSWACTTIEMAGHIFAHDFMLMIDDIWVDLDKITCPVLLIQGEFNQETTTEFVKNLSQKFPNGDFHMVKDRGQFIFPNGPEELIKIIQQQE